MAGLCVLKRRRLADAVGLGMPQDRERWDDGQVVSSGAVKTGQGGFVIHGQPFRTMVDNETKVKMELQKGYRARIRWRSTGRDWELETEHGRFASGEEAALFANGLCPEPFVRLWVFQGALTAELVDGRRVGDIEAVATWRMGDVPDGLPEEARFEQVTVTLEDLSRDPLPMPFEPRTFVVLDSAGRHLAADIDVDLTGQVVRVTVGAVEPCDGTPPLLIPRA